MGADAAQDAVSKDAHSDRSSTSLSSINNQLLTHGWTKRPLNLGSLCERDLNDVVAVLYELIGAGVSNITTLDGLSARHRTLAYEHERTTKTVSQLKAHNAKLEAEAQGWKARCNDAEKRLALEEARSKELREECGRGRKVLEGVRVAAGHEAKKAQMRFDKAQSQLNKVANDASLLSRPQGLVLLNPITGGRSHPVAPGQPALLEQSLRELTEIRQNLQEETEAFRHVIVSTANGLREAVALAVGEEVPERMLHSQFFTNPAASFRTHAFQPTTSTTTTSQFASSTSHPSIADARFKALIAQVRTRLAERSPAPRVVQLGSESVLTEEELQARKKAEREEEKLKQDLEDRVKDLEVEVTCAKAREEEARRLVEELTRMQVQAGSARGSNVGAGDEDEDLALELARQKTALDQERWKVTEAASRLSQERRQLELERESFLAERRRADVDAMLAFLPSTPDEAASALPSSGSGTDSNTTTPPPQVSSNRHAHMPASPSPLSPSVRPRTPKSHPAGKRRTKTPLSRLVLEKVARQKSKEGGAPPHVPGVLGEGGRRMNVGPTAPGLRSEHGRGKERSVSSQNLKNSARREAAPLKSSTSGPKPARDLSVAEGIGPRGAAAKAGRAWR